MLHEVYEFNKVKNGFKYDYELEISMYNEEVKEFFDGNTTAERLDALVDCSYVRMGTMCKLGYNNLSISDLPYDKSVEGLMVSILVEEMGQDLFNRAIRLAEDIVCAANACKPDTLVDGKVAKNADTPDATAQIDDMLKNLFEERDAVLEAQAKSQQMMFDEASSN